MSDNKPENTPQPLPPLNWLELSNFLLISFAFLSISPVTIRYSSDLLQLIDSSLALPFALIVAMFGSVSIGITARFQRLREGDQKFLTTRRATVLAIVVIVVEWAAFFGQPYIAGGNVTAATAVGTTTASPTIIDSVTSFPASPTTLTVHRRRDTLALCTDKQTDLSELKLDFDQNDYFLLGEAFSENAVISSSNCVCIQQNGTSYGSRIPPVCDGAELLETSTNRGTRSWYLAPLTLEFPGHSPVTCEILSEPDQVTLCSMTLLPTSP